MNTRSASVMGDRNENHRRPRAWLSGPRGDERVDRHQRRRRATVREQPIDRLARDLGVESGRVTPAVDDAGQIDEGALLPIRVEPEKITTGKPGQLDPGRHRIHTTRRRRHLKHSEDQRAGEHRPHGGAFNQSGTSG
jgi:hypothetical protein